MATPPLAEHEVPKEGHCSQRDTTQIVSLFLASGRTLKVGKGSELKLMNHKDYRGHKMC